MATKGLSYTQRTLRALRDLGRICAISEKWNPYGGPVINGKQIGRRVDLFGFIDIVCLGPGQKILGIQSTGPSGFSSHRKAVLENELAIEWLKAGGYIELWSWRKLLKRQERGGKLRTWQAKILEFTLQDFELKPTIEKQPNPMVMSKF